MEGIYQNPDAAEADNTLVCPVADVDMVPLSDLCDYTLRWIPNAPTPELFERCEAEGRETATIINVEGDCGVQEGTPGRELNEHADLLVYACDYLYIPKE